MPIQLGSCIISSCYVVLCNHTSSTIPTGETRSGSKPVTRTGYPQWGYYLWLMGNTWSWVRVRVSIGIPTGYPHRSLDVTPGDTWKPRLDGPAQGFLQCKPSPEPYRACYVRSSTCNSRLQGTVGSSREFWHLMTNEEVWGLSSNSSSKLKR